MANTKIEWTDKVWNIVTGCEKVSAGCKNCYAETYAKRFWGERKFTDVQCHEDKLELPLHWKKPQKIFVNSMSDLFHPDVPFEFIDSVFRIMVNSRQHIFQILTKRPERMLEFCRCKYFPTSDDDKEYRDKYFSHIWLGVSCEDQKTANKRIPLLLQAPSAVRFVSLEPLLGEIDLSKWNHKNACGCLDRFDVANCPHCNNTGVVKELDWVIVGGESGKNARPMHPDWARSLRNQCKIAGVPFFFKQWGEYLPADHWGKDDIYNATGGIFLLKDGATRKFNFDSWNQVHEDKNIIMPFGRVGKKAGRLLDEVEYNEFPKGE